MKFQVEISKEQMKNVTHLQAILNLKSIDDVVAQALWLLGLVIKQKQ